MTDPGGRDGLSSALGSTRRRLFLVTLALLGLLVVGIGATAALAGLQALDADVDRALSDSARAALASLDGELPVEEEPSDTEERPSSSDTFVLYLDPRGAIVADPSRVRLAGLPDTAAIAAARSSGRDLRSITAGGIPIRLLTLPIAAGSRAAPVGYVQAGFVLTLHDAQATSLITAVALAGVLGLAGATLVTIVVTGRALVPIRRALASQQRFIADASHELRTPAALIRSNAEVLERERLVGADGAPLLADIVGEADRLGRLVDDLLALASADASLNAVFVRRREPVDLASIAEDGSRRAEALAAAHDVKLAVESRSAAVVRGDRDRLLQLVLILVDNAIRHSPRGRTVRIAVQGADGQASLSVDDEGPGVPADQRERVFEPFARLPDTDRDGRGGTGLGLAIGRRIAIAHDGTVRAEDSPRGGARFVVTLPTIRRGRVATLRGSSS